MLESTVFGSALEASFLADGVVAALDCVAAEGPTACRWVADALARALEFVKSAQDGRSLVLNGTIHARALGSSRAYHNALRALHYLQDSSRASSVSGECEDLALELTLLASTLEQVHHSLVFPKEELLPSKEKVLRCRNFFSALRKVTLLENAGPVGESVFSPGVVLVR